MNNLKSSVSVVDNESPQMNFSNSNELLNDNEVCLSDNDNFVDILSNSFLSERLHDKNTEQLPCTEVSNKTKKAITYATTSLSESQKLPFLFIM